MINAFFELVHFVPSATPYYDFLYASKPLPQIATKFGLFDQGERKGLPYHLYSNGDLREGSEGEYVLFSGEGYHSEKYYSGADNKTYTNAQELFDIYGCVSGVVCSEKKMTFFTDYFGQEKIFYFKNENILLISNRLHLLAISMKFAGIKLEIDKDIFESHFYSLSDILSSQPFSTDLLIKGVKFADITQKLSIKEDELCIEESLFALEKKPFENKKLSQSKYAELIAAAKDEIIGNIKAVINSEKFDHFVFDISGGVDSRLLFAAITNIPDAPKFFKAYSYGADHEKKIAYALLKEFGFSYDSVFFRSDYWTRLSGTDTTTYSIENFYNYLLSYEFCSYFDADSFIGKFGVILNRTAHFSGGAGENIRPYLSHSFNLQSDDLTLSMIAAERAKKLGGSSLVSYDTFGKKYAQKLSDSLTEFGNHSISCSLESLYLHYRQRFHFNTKTNNNHRTPLMMPLLSKYAYFAFLVTNEHYAFQKSYFDLLNAMNPVVAAYAFEDEKNNIERVKFAKKIMGPDDGIKSVTIREDVSLDEWTKAYIEAMNGSFKNSKEEAARLNKNYHDWWDQSSLQRLYSLTGKLYSSCAEGFPELFNGELKKVFDRFFTRTLDTNDRNFISIIIKLYRRFSSIYEIHKINTINENLFVVLNNKSVKRYDYSDFIPKQN